MICALVKLVVATGEALVEAALDELWGPEEPFPYESRTTRD